MKTRLTSCVLATALVAATGCSGTEPARTISDPPAQVTTSPPEIPRGSDDGDLAGSVGDRAVSGEWTVTCEPLQGDNLHVEATGQGEDRLDVYRSSGGRLSAFDLTYGDLETTIRTSVDDLRLEPTDSGYRVTGSQYVNGETEVDVDLTITCPA